MRQVFTFGVVLLMGGVALAQDDSPAAEVARLTGGARKVVVGRVVAVQPRFESNRFGDELIVSHAVVEVSETLKGTAQPTINVAVEGGSVGGLTLEVSDMPTLAVGDEAVMFLDLPAAGDATPHDRGRGIMKLDARRRVRGNGPSLDEIRAHVRSAVARGAR